jgi:hypothetical protein
VQASERKLVNVLGGLQVAVDRAKEQSGLGKDVDVSLLPYPPPQPLTEQIRQLLFEGASVAAATKVPLPDALRRLAAQIAELPSGTPLLVPPVLVDVH